MQGKTPFFLLGSMVFLGACTTIPTGPSVMTLPGSSRSFDQFRADEIDCRAYAQQQIGGSPKEAAAQSGVQSAAVGTVVGAAAGAAMGGNNGAGAGAGVGLIVGAMSGAGAAQETAYGTQKQYDNAYIQCMYARGHKVPVSPAMARSLQQAAPATPSNTALPPPSGVQPPPPPDRIRR